MVFSTTVVFPTASTPSIIINVGSFSRFSFFNIFFRVSFVIFLSINSFLFIHFPFSYHLQYFNSSLFSLFTLYSSILFLLLLLLLLLFFLFFCFLFFFIFFLFCLYFVFFFFSMFNF